MVGTDHGQDVVTGGEGGGSISRKETNKHSVVHLIY